MKKFVLLSLVMLTCASNMAFAGKNKDKKNKAKTETVAEPLKLTTPSDSVSYAAGMTFTNGLMPYLIGQLKVDTAYIADFLEGFKEAMTMRNDKQYVAREAGRNIAGQVSSRFLPSLIRDLEGTKDSIQTNIMTLGFIAALSGDTTWTLKNAQSYFENRVEETRAAKEKAYREANEQWLKTNATKPGVTTLPSGLQYKILSMGTGKKPLRSDRVEVIYEGKLIDGTVFDATKNHNGKKTDEFGCGEVIKGWTEALTMMPVGSKWEIYIPQELGYANRQAGQIKPYSTLIFTVELVSIKEKPADKTDSSKPATAEKKQAPAKKAASAKK